LISYRLVGMVSRWQQHNPTRREGEDTCCGFAIIRIKGYAAATTDGVFRAGGQIKGIFFQHFKSKEAFALAVTANFAVIADGVCWSAPYRALPNPRDRVVAYVKFRATILNSPVCSTQ
jgi:TetR/AcrR family transcriptional regulator, transcriptional repressor for nem operon